jgi:antitoxin (DNA-binding transcriptional repressor) of toxin-antitoxin stability system
MRSVGIKLLKNKLSEYIRLAAGGETVLVTDRDRVVAELGPPAPAGARWFRTRSFSMPFGRGGSDRRCTWKGIAGAKTRDETQ